ncbi:sacsin-like [Haliotis cracherodii]|uniref:sacsin-like n=1 Tax=Haliotis cracherodii TaxID=6455 RepID=UPI0039ED71A1
MSAPGGRPREGFSSMRLPSLIKQLKVVLDQYPDDGQILKELIQNAEDADATEVKILYDGRPFSPSSVDGFPHLRTLKGPGLCVYNDGVFTDEDWDGIRMLQSSIKEQEPLKVGRFGLGFKSVFHLTDVPLIISGHNILLLDPYMWEDDPRMVCYISRLDRIGFSNDLLLRVLDGIFGFSAQTLQDGFFKGTLFWFPLRGEVTELSDNIYDDNKIQDLFSAFQAEAPHMLLFLKSLSRIQVCQKGASLFGKQVPENSCETLFTVDTSSYVGDTVNIRKEFVESIKELKGGLPKSPIEKIYYMKVETCDFMSTHQNCNNSIWLVIQHFQDGKISKSFKKLCFDKAFASCPCVGLAFALEQEQTGHIFCFLPLPLEAQSPTGLPIHVHGHFALSQNRRHIKWPTADQTKNKSQMDKAIRWNQCLLLEVFPQTYVSLIQELIMYWQREGRDETCVEKIYRALPDKSQIRENWKGLCEAFYKLMFRERSLYTPNDGGKWINAENGILFVPSKVSSEIQETIVVTYKMSQENIVVVPPHLHEALRSYYPDLDQLKFVTPDGLSKTLQSKNLYPGITDQQKLHLLEFICTEDTFQCLRGVRLLPLADGSFTTFGEAEPVFLCEDEDDINMFPGLGHRFVLHDGTTGHYLQDMAKKGMFNIQRLSPEPFARLLKECMEVQFPSGVATVTSDSQFSPEWLDSVWQYITKHVIDVKDKFPDDLLIPGEATADGTMPLYPVSSSFICMNVKTVGDLDQRLGLALEHLDIIPLSKIPDALKRNASIIGDVIKYPSFEGVISVLEDVAQKDTLLEKVSNFNNFAKDDEKWSLIEFLCKCKCLSSSAKEVLQKLELFAKTENLTTDNLDMDTTIEQIKLLEPADQLVVPYPEVYLRCSPATTAALSQLLDARQVTRDEVTLNILKLMANGDDKYNRNDVKVFMLHLLKECHFFTNQAILKLAKRIQFLTTDEMSEQFRVCDLFEPQPELCMLFEREDKFPANEFMDSSLLQGLKMLGLKTVTDVTDAHLCHTGAVIESLLGTNEFEVAARKGKALFAFLKARLAKPYKHSLKSLLQVRFVPRLVRRTGYPDTLRLFGEENSCLLERLGNVWNENHLNVIGSVSPVAKLPKDIISAFQLVSEPPLHQVLEHMDLTIASYQPQQDTEHKYMEVMKDLYRYLSKQNVSSMTKACKERLRKMKFIWINSEFHFASQIWTMKSKRKDIELKPYRFCLPKLWIGIADIVEAVGGQKQQSPEMLVSVLKEIQHKHLQARMDNSDDMQEDLQIIFHIINTLKSYKFHSNEIILPIHQDEYSKSLVLKSAEDCTFCNAEWLLEQTTDGEEEEKLYFVHSDISEETARYFGASLLTERVMEGTEAFDLNCGQHESLTKRLNGILRGYTDGFSVPKEIIQNAEDAKATKVMFLYDERHNSSARTSLMNKGMESLQGPALWSYNDAQFTEDDFLNIQDLGGATKEDDATKLGRFGLGFNSVYNLTDVPSFISGNTVVIFDPHRTYLGRPGLKADLSSVKNRRMLQTMRGQFQPFDGVFGCDIGQKGKGDICKGTLFRFPLRTAEQAEKSEIKHLHYSKSEMKTFLEILVKGAGNLLLYTQNVKLMEVYYLPNGASVDKCELLFSVQKKTDDQFSVFNQAKVPHNPQINTLSHFSKQCNMDSREDYLIERVNVSVKTTTEFSNSFGIKVHQDNTNWQITWSMGKTVPGQFATIKGLLPLASTAVPLSTSGDIIQMSSLRECQSFFCVGHLYCFLPLPLPSTQFAMHINAQFALTEDRRRLCEKTEDDKTSIPGSWNKHLETEVISRTIICTLTGLENLTQKDAEAYYNLWPGVMLNKDVNAKNSLEKPAIVTSFYKVITEEEYKVFLQGDPVNYVAFKNSIFLSPSLAYNEFIGKTAVGVLQRFWEKDTVIDLPERIYQNFISAGLTETFNSRVVSTEDFYKEVFLPNIELVNSSDRQSLTLYAVKQCVPNIDALLKKYECIPSKPNGKLRKPKELVHPRGKVSQLFTESEEIFPGEAFERHEILKQLCCLGMVENVLPWNAIIGRIETVQDLSLEDNTRAEKRCLYILQYINEYDSSTRGRRFHKCGEDARQQISTMAFLPVMQKPRDWPFTWKGDTVSVFSTPVQLFFHEEADLVGCCNLLLDSYKLDGLFSLKEVLIWLGVQDTKSVTATVACEQLLHISTQILTGVQLSKESIKILNNLYKHLDALCKEVDSTSPEHDLIAKLKGKQVILNDKMLVFPQQVAFHLEYNLHPYLYQIEPTQRYLYKNFLRVIGIKEHFDVDCVKEQIDKMAETYKDKPMRKEDVTKYVNMANLLCKLSEKESCVNSELWQIFLPDTENSLKLATDLCLDDCSRLKKDSGIQIVHPSISKDVALHFKVKTLIHASVEKVLLPWSATSFGQREKLTTRLRGILEGYPRDSSIMKELLQNADDAGATELKFIKDFRNHPTQNVFSDNWKPLQGPALCVWNNSSFTEKDFEGIQSLGVGSKSDDALKTGQYGVGFNAVYHLTDVPSFFTVGPETPETVCFLDPNLKYIPWATSEAPGCRFPAAELQYNFQDIFKCYLTDVIDFGESGTLFRLPLRTKEMVSDISDEEIPIEGKMGIEQLLKDFRNEMAESLLFLHNIKNISIHSVTKDGKLVEDFSVSAEISDQHAGLKKYASGLQTYVKHKEQDVTKQTKVVLKVKSLEGKQERWLVVHKCGFADNSKVPEILKECQRDGKIGMLPRGGVAIPLDDNTVHGKAFCMLPLRITTKLPVHINGHFALDHEARGNLWHGPHPFRTLWNEAIIQQVIVPAYVSGLETLIGPELLGAQLTQDSILRCFTSQLPIIVTVFTELIKGSPGMAMHRSMEQLYSGFTDKSDTLRKLDIQTLSTLLPDTMGHIISTVPIPWERSGKPSPQWILDIWDFLHREIVASSKMTPHIDSVKSSLSSLSQMCIIPAKVTEKSQTVIYLFPICDSDKILDLLDMINITYQTIFSELCVPQLDFGETASNCKEFVKLAKTLVANLQRPASTLKALAQHTHKLIGIKEGSAKILQQYFCTNLKDLQTLEIPMATELLKSLPIYEDLSGSCQHMKMARVYAVIEHHNIPQDGIETWSLGLKTCLLKCSDRNKNLFEFLKVQILSPEELYEKIILEKFSHLPKPTQAVHLRYVRDHLLKTSFSSNYSSVQKRLIQCLKRLHFIEDKDGSLHRACEYYLKRGTLFAEFLSEDKFPPPPYDSSEWVTFLKESGIVIKVSEEDFEKFARSVEDMNVTPIPRDVEHKSNLLTNHLFEKQEGLLEGSLLSRVKNIKFVMPHNMEKESNEKDMTKQILPQFQQGKLIAYADSVSSKHCHYIWTSCAMFHHYADPDYYKNGHSRKDREKMALLLGIKKEPSIESVVQHIVNISTSLEQRQQTCPHKGPRLVELLEMVLKSIYTFLQDNTSNLTEKLKKRLKAAFVVFLPQEGLFVKPSQVVLEVSGTDTMQGIYKAPVEFGPYFKLFSLLGAAAEVTTKHYAEVLQVLAQTTADGKLEPNELKIVQKATDMLFKCLQKEEKDNKIALAVQYLFLLDRDCKLIKSTSLVIADNESLENRVKTLNFRYFVGFKRLEISKTNEVDVFEQLPEIYRPKILDQMTNEVMCETSHNEATEGSVSSEYSQKITNPEFVIGLIRLINDSQRLGRVEKLTETELKNIEMKLANMSIKQITGLKTVLIHGGLVVEGSDREQSCFLDYEDENKVTVYINTRKLNQVLLHSKLATAINKLTGGYIAAGQVFLVSMLASDPGKIKAYLDGMSVQPTSYICSYIKDSVFPPPGTRIPEEFHWMLDNSFTRFDVEEYVGMEIYDPLTDDRIGQEGSALPNPDSGPVYIYAKVKQILTSETLPILDRYAVDVGEEGIQEVSALDLFKFQRQKGSQCREIVFYNRSQHDEGNTPGPETETGEVPRKKEQQATPSEDKPLDMDSVLKEIRETLKVAWQMPDTKQREKVKKRLLFKWHPDKNQGNEEFCTKVFQRIQNYIEMLEKGQNIDEAPGHTNARPKSERSNFDNWFYEEMNRRSKRHRHDYEHYWDDDGDFFSNGFHSRSGRSSYRAHHTEKPNPQPEEARRWMRQAREDLRVARETMQTLSAYNWSCFQCYMACDKAVKALLYYSDAKEGDEQRTQDLSLVVCKLQDKSMRDMVRKLLSIVQNTSHAQYPKKLKFPYIPAETFSHSNAREACDISECVLQRAGELIG